MALVLIYSTLAVPNLHWLQSGFIVVNIYVQAAHKYDENFRLFDFGRAVGGRINLNYLQLISVILKCNAIANFYASLLALHTQTILNRNEMSYVGDPPNLLLTGLMVWIWK